MMVGMDNVVDLAEYRRRREQAQADMAARVGHPSALDQVLSGALSYTGPATWVNTPVPSGSTQLTLDQLLADVKLPPQALLLPPHWAPLIRQVLATGDPEQ